MWQVFLVTGLQFLRRILARTLSLTTDTGTESYIPAVADIVPSLFEHLGCPRNKIPPSTGRLLPRAMHIRGWRHFIDNLLHDGLCSLPWFPRWLTGFKAICAGVRDAGWRGSITRSLRRRGYAGLAEMIKQMSLNCIAEWRWITL